MKSPVLFLIFSRLDTTMRVFEAIAKAKPPRLYVAADGPRQSRGEEEAEKCRITRQAVLDNIDWPCEVHTLLRDENLGCGKAVSGALQWFFENEEEGIILEDDCLPHLEFFEFCDQMLERYRDEINVRSIGGYNFGLTDNLKESYYFSAYNFIWGWAAWRRVMEDYDYCLSNTTLCQYRKAMNRYGFSSKEKTFATQIFLITKQTKVDTWDYQMTISLQTNNRLSIIPKTTLIQNLGFGEGATHTSCEIPSYIDRPAQPILPIVHPLEIERAKELDRVYIEKIQYNKKGKKYFLKLLLKYILGCK